MSHLNLRWAPSPDTAILTTRLNAHPTWSTGRPLPGLWPQDIQRKTLSLPLEERGRAPHHCIPESLSAKRGKREATAVPRNWGEGIISAGAG